MTLEGRLVAAMLMAVGVGLFGTLSGLVASWFLHQPEHEEANAVAALAAEVAALRSTISRSST